ncbi:AraC family transcriptional regulator [Streptomyces sp. PKU-EA00015]|uniref:AraC family transcriptional regulator n=1 Tax=Streptomyces sp. PKU-EA00015 TaxID=2748326 RepID=UPI0015A2D030|nr:AraC family transcriptional regulator [Streptomyces sp. PKU-EA00015]NWF25479.1 AraC family transcriptional regulator [Streptomyces sp. PKU-EA00015]
MKRQAAQARFLTDPRYGSATITPHLLRYLTLVAAERGHDLGPPLRRAGLSEAALSAVGQRISYRQGSSVIREAMRDLDDPALGLAVGRRQRATAWGLVGLGLQASPTLHDALELGVRHHGVTGSMLDYRTRTVPDGAAILATARYTDSELRAFLLEKAFAGIVALVRDSLDETFAPHTVAVHHPRPPYGDAYEDYFRCPVVFDAPDDRIVFGGDWLRTPLPGADAYTLAQVIALLDAARAQGRDRQDLVQGLEVSVARGLPHVPPLAQQALARGMSERTLRRRLAEHGTSYEALVDSVRLVRAEELITGSDLPLHNIAGLLGFSDARTLRRAVARWFGTSPSALRGTRCPQRRS